MMYLIEFLKLIILSYKYLNRIQHHVYYC